MANIPVWRGSKDIKETASSPKFEDGKDGSKYTRTFEGPYTAIVAARPKRLSTMKGYPSTHQVDTVSSEKLPGGRGRMTVTLTTNPDPSSSGGDGTPDPVYEMEWTEVQKKLETHPRYSTGGAKELSDNDLADLEGWKDETSIIRKKAFKYVDTKDNAEKTLSANAQDFAKKLLKGTDSYVVYSPLARVTTYHATRPKTGGCGKRSAPPSDVAIAGYIYVKAADRAQKRSRQWERVQEWNGAEVVDSDLYPT